MDYILVNIKLSKENSQELKIPADIAAGELLEILKQVFHLESLGKAALHIEPLGRILGADEVLCEEGVYNGAQITLV